MNKCLSIRFINSVYIELCNPHKCFLTHFLQIFIPMNVLQNHIQFSMADSNEELLESIINEQEQLKRRLNNFQKLVSIVTSSVVKHKKAFPNLNEKRLKEIVDEGNKVI